MATAQNILDDIALTDSAKDDVAANIKAVNFAIDSSWPSFRITEYAAAGTFDASTFTYSLALLTTIDVQAGVSRVSVIPTNANSVDVSHRCRQYYDHSATAWTLDVAPAIAQKYHGYPFYVDYQYRHPRITTLADTVYLPIDVAADAALLWFSMFGGTEENVDNAFWKAFAPEKLRARVLWKAVRSPVLPRQLTSGRGGI
jgi:hypothetical protein